jgi:hypothetical protein
MTAHLLNSCQKYRIHTVYDRTYGELLPKIPYTHRIIWFWPTLLIVPLFLITDREPCTTHVTSKPATHQQEIYHPPAANLPPTSSKSATHQQQTYHPPAANSPPTSSKLATHQQQNHHPPAANSLLITSKADQLV